MEDHKSLYVIDASVMIKWIVMQEDDIDKALEIRDDFFREKISLAMPSNALFEILNVMSIKRPVEAMTFFSQILSMGIDEYVLTLEPASQAIAMLERIKGISFYDAIYHALALILGGTFVTADKDYYKKTKSLGRIMLLKDYKTV